MLQMPKPFFSVCPSHIKSWPLHRYQLPAFVLEPGQEARNGNRAASYEMSLARRPSTAASMLVKGRQHCEKDVDHQRHLNTAEAIGMRHLDVESPRLSNASQTHFRIREMLPDLQAEVEDDRVTRERQEEINGEAAGEMQAMIPSVRNTTMPSHSKK